MSVRFTRRVKWQSVKVSIEVKKSTKKWTIIFIKIKSSLRGLILTTNYCSIELIPKWASKILRPAQTVIFLLTSKVWITLIPQITLGSVRTEMWRLILSRMAAIVSWALLLTSVWHSLKVSLIWATLSTSAINIFQDLRDSSSPLKSAHNRGTSSKCRWSAENPCTSKPIRMRCSSNTSSASTHMEETLSQPSTQVVLITNMRTRMALRTYKMTSQVRLEIDRSIQTLRKAVCSRSMRMRTSRMPQMGLPTDPM